MNTEDALTPGDKEVMLQGWSESVKGQLAEGIHKDEIIKQITATGLEHDAVEKFVEDLDQVLPVLIRSNERFPSRLNRKRR